MIDELFWEEMAGKWSVEKEQETPSMVLPPLTSVEDEWPMDELDQELEDLLREIEL